MSFSVTTLILLKDKGFTVSGVAKSLSVNRQQIYKAIHCSPHSSRRVRLYISSLVGRPPSLLFIDLPDTVKIVDDFEFMNSNSESKSKSEQFLLTH